MESGYRNSGENIYFACRKKAAKTNERLSSRENAAELLGVSVSTLANYELGITKSVPVEMVVLMADLYNAPELKYMYCKNDCPIGKCHPYNGKEQTLESMVIQLVNSFDDDRMHDMKKKLLEIAEDGEVTEDETEAFQKIVSEMSKMQEAITSIRILQERILGGKKTWKDYLNI